MILANDNRQIRDLKYKKNHLLRFDVTDTLNSIDKCESIDE